MTSPVILETRAAVEPSLSGNLTKIVVYKYSAHCFSLEFESELVRFRPRLQDKRSRQNRLATKELASKLGESDKGSYYNQEKWLKDDKAPEKPIETTAELISERKRAFWAAKQAASERRSYKRSRAI